MAFRLLFRGEARTEKELAEKAGFSVSTLRRALREADLRFGELRAAALRARTAQLCAASPGMPSKAIADALGFSSANAFYHFCRRHPLIP